MSRETKSADRAEYRYIYTRDLGSLLTLEAPRRVLFCMLNPSTATAETDDPTIRRVIQFAAREDATELAVVNLFAARATDPRKLPAFDDPVGPDNDTIIEQPAAAADLIIAAWGVTTREGTQRTSPGGPRHAHPARRRPPRARRHHRMRRRPRRQARHPRSLEAALRGPPRVEGGRSGQPRLHPVPTAGTPAGRGRVLDDAPHPERSSAPCHARAARRRAPRLRQRARSPPRFPAPGDRPVDQRERRTDRLPTARRAD